MIDILISAPADPSQILLWGDYHYALAIGKAFNKNGLEYNILYADTHVHHVPTSNDTLLVIRGKNGFNPTRWQSYKIYKKIIMWNISWPSRISPAEIEYYHHIFVASSHFAAQLKLAHGDKISFLPQCTSFNVPVEDHDHYNGVLFIGNTRGKERPIVSLFHRQQVPIEVIGNGWSEQQIYAARYMVENHKLPLYYSKALVVLNDHHDDMLEYQFLNNRVFDVLACGCPIISDQRYDCPEPALDGVIDINLINFNVYTAIERAMDLRGDISRMSAIQNYMRSNHSFDKRAEVILSRI